MNMGDELTTIYHVLKALVWAIVGILIAIFALLAFAIVTPVLLRGLLESSTVSESIREAARSLMEGLDGLGSAVLGLIVAFIVILIIVSIGLEMLRTMPWRHVKVTDEAFETLKMRYAKGEITKEQFLEMKKALETGA
jgi:uncharacterized membrane protein